MARSLGAAAPTRGQGAQATVEGEQRGETPSAPLSPPIPPNVFSGRLRGQSSGVFPSSTRKIRRGRNTSVPRRAIPDSGFRELKERGKKKKTPRHQPAGTQAAVWKVEE